MKTTRIIIIFSILIAIGVVAWILKSKKSTEKPADFTPPPIPVMPGSTDTLRNDTSYKASYPEGFSPEVKTIPAMNILSIREKVPNNNVGLESDKRISKIANYMLKHGSANPITESNKPMNIYYGMPDSNIDMESAIPVSRKYTGGEGITFRQLPSMKIVSIVHHGPYENIEGTYTALRSWIKEKGYKYTGSCHEIYLTAGKKNQDPSKMKVEIQFPVE